MMRFLSVVFPGHFFNENAFLKYSHGGRKMRIDHSALYVEYLEREKAFFEEYFNAEASGLYHNFKTGFRSYFLSFGEGSRLEIMTRDDLSVMEKPLFRSGFHHISFCVGTKEDVDKLTYRLKEDGYTCISGPRLTGDGYYESCILDSENNQIEIMAEKGDNL